MRFQAVFRRRLFDISPIALGFIYEIAKKCSSLSGNLIRLQGQDRHLANHAILRLPFLEWAQAQCSRRVHLSRHHICPPVLQLTAIR